MADQLDLLRTNKFAELSGAAAVLFCLLTGIAIVEEAKRAKDGSTVERYILILF